MKKVLLLLLTIVTLGFAAAPLSAQETLTVAEGTSTNYYVPIYGLYLDNYIRSQIIYPESMLNDLEGNIITQLTFYFSTQPTNPSNWTSILDCKLGTVSQTTFSSTSFLPAPEQVVWTGVPDGTSSTMTILFDEPFMYEGGNLLLEFVSETKAGYSGAYFYGISSTGSSLTTYNSTGASTSTTGTQRNFIPKTTFTYVSGGGSFCHAVSHLTAETPTTDGATISWNAPEDAGSYILQFKTSNLGWDDDDVVTVYPTDTAYDFFDNPLDPNTKYDVRVANLCTSGDTSSWRNVSFKTECVAISVSDAPYYEQFEGYAANSFPDCWTKVTGYSSYPSIANSATTAHQGQGYLNASNTNATPIIMALPPFEEDLSTLRLSFWMKPAGSSSYYGRVELGVMTDLSDTSSFTLLKSWTAVGINSTNWTYYEINLDTVDIETGYLTFRRFGGSSTSYAWYFDDVKVMPIPACEAPTELEFFAATSSSVDLKWNPGENTDFTVYYKPANSEEEYSSAINATLDADSIYTLEGLDPATEYSIYVASVCVDGSENYCDPILGFTTMIPAELPYSTDFSEDADRNWLLNNGTCVNHWMMGEIPDTTVSALYITNNDSTAQYTISSAISMVSAAKLFTIGTAPQAIISFDVMIGGESSYDYLKLFFAPETETYPAKAGTTPTSNEYGYNSYDTYAFDFSDYLSLSTSSSNIRWKYNLTNGVVHIDALMPNPHSNPNENSTAQVVFAWKNDGGGGVQPGAIISNVTVTVPSCHRPEDLVATNVTAHTADLSWNGGEATQWTVEYGVHGFTLGQGLTIDVENDPETSLSDLADNTEYDVYVKAICGDMESANKLISFTTPCVGLTEIPYICTFDSNLVGTGTYLLPSCWTRILSPSTTTAYPYAINSSTSAHSGSRALYFYNGYPNSYAVMQGIDATELNIHNLQVSFYAKSSSASASASLEVGVMTDPTDTATFTLIQAFQPTASYTSEPFVVPLSNYTGSGSYIAFRNTITASATNSYYVDDVKLEVIPNCSKALLLTATPSTHEAELSWAATGNSFDLHYKKSSETNYTVIEDVTVEDGAYLLSELDASTQYNWYIVTHCEDATTFTSDVASFVTGCELLSSIPQTWDFESGLVAGTTSYPLPVCWNRILSSSSTTTLYPYVYSATATSTTPHSGTHYLYFYNSYLNAYAIMPAIDPDELNINELQISFFAKISSASDNVRLVVGVMDNPDSVSTFTAVDTFALTNEYGVDPFIVSFENYEGEGTYIAFKNTTANGSTVANGLYIDDVTLEEIPSCNAPTGTSYFAADNFVNISWDNMTEGTYNVYYKADSDSVYIPIENVLISDDFFTIDDLDASTTYNFYVATVCDDGSESSTNEYTFTTLCSPYPTPFTENFSTSVVPQCWAKAIGLASDAFAGHNPTPTTSGWISNTNVFGHSHPKLNIFSTGTKYWLISPAIDLSELSSPALQFNLALTDYGNSDPIENPTSQQDDKFMVIISTDFGETWNEADATIWSNDSTAQYVYNQIPHYGQEIQIPLDEYAGQTIRIAFYGESTASGGDNDLHIDNVVVGEAITCLTPYAIAVSNVTETTATVSWNGNDGSSWKVEYGLEGFTPGEGGTIVTVTDTFTTLSDLTSNTHYEVYVSTVCGDEFSNSIHTTFHTECSDVTIPYSENFNSYTTSATTSYPSNYPNDVLPDCWQFLNRSTSTSSYPMVYVSSASAYAVSGNCLFFKSSYSTPIYAVLPHFTEALNTLQITFTYRNESTSSSNGILSLGYMTDPTNASTFTQIASYPITTTLTEITKMLDTIPATAANGYLAFKYMGQSSTNNMYLSLDDIYVETIPTCLRPSNVTASNPTTNSITLSWTAGGTEEAWEIAYGAPGFDPNAATSANIVSADTNPFTVSGLSSSTNYEFYVRAICTETDHSNWSNAGSGATECDVITQFPYTEGFENGLGCWNSNPVTGSINWTTASYYYSSSTAPVENSHIAYLYNGSHGMVTDLTSPIFDLTSLSNPYLSFYQIRTLWVNDLDSLKLYYKTSSTAEPVLLASYTNALTTWAFDSIALPNPSAEYQIIFRGYIEYGHGIGIDAITIADANGSTPVVTLPSVTTVAADPVGQTTATLNATITNPDGVAITGKGFQWKVNGGDYQNVTGSGSGNTFVANLTNLTANTQYFFKAYIMTADTTVYGEELPFTTSSTPTPPATPTVTTNDATYTQTTATLYASINNPSSVNITGKGFQWKVNGGNYQNAAGTGTGNDFSAELTNLTPNTQYFYKAYITTADTTVYGAELNFTTLPEDVEPCATPTGLNTTDITKESVKVIWDNVDGVIWHIQYRQGDGAFSTADASTNSYVITDLNPETTYEIQVQADCGDGNVSAWATTTATTLADGVNNYLENSVVLYPNPAKEVINVQCTMNEWNGATIEVLDVYGKLLQTLKADSEITQINVSNLANGMYFVRMTTEQGVVTKRFVKK